MRRLLWKPSPQAWYFNVASPIVVQKPGTLSQTSNTLTDVDAMASQLGPALSKLRPGARALGPSLDERPRIRVSAGSAVALAVWLAASGGLAVYSASFGSFEKTWGTLSAVVVTLVWLWLGGAALLLGAEIDAASRALREALTGVARRPGGGVV